MRDYWLERFTVDEIRELAGALWQGTGQAANEHGTSPVAQVTHRNR
jgi:hypothetical protein